MTFKEKICNHINILLDNEPNPENKHNAFAYLDKELITHIFHSPNSENLHKIFELELQRRFSNRQYRAVILAVIATMIIGLSTIVSGCITKPTAIIQCK